MKSLDATMAPESCVSKPFSSPPSSFFLLIVCAGTIAEVGGANKALQEYAEDDDFLRKQG